MTLNDFKWPFYDGFGPVCLCVWALAFRANCVKVNKDTRILTAADMYSRGSSFCAVIRESFLIHLSAGLNEMHS